MPLDHVFHDTENNLEKQNWENNKGNSGQRDFSFFGEEWLCFVLYDLSWDSGHGSEKEFEVFNTH